MTILHNATLEAMAIPNASIFGWLGNQDVFLVEYEDNTVSYFIGEQLNDDTILWFGWC